MLIQVVLLSTRHVVSDISPFLLASGLAMCCPVAAEAEAVAVFLEFFPIWIEFAASEELCTGVKMNVMWRIDNTNQRRTRYINQ